SLAPAAPGREGLRRRGHEVLDVRIERDGTWRRDGAELTLRAGGGLLDADAAFPALHGPYGEDGTVQGLLECLDVPYVGAGVLASALCMDKAAFKRLMAQAGMPQVRYEVVSAVDWLHARAPVLERVLALGFPSFVKPARLGSSLGISKVSTEAELPGAIEVALEHDPVCLVEAA